MSNAKKNMNHAKYNIFTPICMIKRVKMINTGSSSITVTEDRHIGLQYFSLNT